MNQNNKDYTQYSIKTAEILTNIFETLNKFKDCTNEEEKGKLYSDLSENISNFELTLDNCSVDINESIAKLIKDRNERRGNINNAFNETDSQNSLPSVSSTEQISDTELINRTVNKISSIKLDI